MFSLMTHPLALGRNILKIEKGALDSESKELYSNPSSILFDLCDLDQMTVCLFFLKYWFCRQKTGI